MLLHGVQRPTFFAGSGDSPLHDMTNLIHYELPQVETKGTKKIADSETIDIINNTDGPFRNLTIVAAFVYQIQSPKDAGPIACLNGLQNLTYVTAFVYQIQPTKDAGPIAHLNR